MGREDWGVLASALEAAARTLRAAASESGAQVSASTWPTNEEDHRSAALSVREAAEELRVGRTTIYALVARGELPSIRIGSRRLILRRDLLEWLSRQAALAEDRSAVTPPSC